MVVYPDHINFGSEHHKRLVCTILDVVDGVLPDEIWTIASYPKSSGQQVLISVIYKLMVFNVMEIELEELSSNEDKNIREELPFLIESLMNQPNSQLAKYFDYKLKDKLSNFIGDGVEKESDTHTQKW